MVKKSKGEACRSRLEPHTCINPGLCYCLAQSSLSSHTLDSPDWLLAKRVTSPPFSSSCLCPLLLSWACCLHWRSRPLTLPRFLSASRFSWPRHLFCCFLHWLLLVCLEAFWLWGLDWPKQNEHCLSSGNSHLRKHLIHCLYCKIHFPCLGTLHYVH